MRFVRILGLLTALLVLAAPIISPVSAVAAPGTVLQLTGGETVRKGGSKTLKVKWTSAGVPVSGTVQLQKHVGGGVWRTARSYPVKSGNGTVKVKPPKNASYRVRAANTVSNIKRMKVDNYYIKTSTTAKTIEPGQTVPVTIKYVKKGELVPNGLLRLQHEVSGTWKTAYSVRITNGRAKITLKPGSTKNYRLMTTNGKRFSPVVTVTVRTPVPPSFTITGSGYGHGIGMSQFGAYQMARLGNSSEQILGHYYRGTQVLERKTPKNIAVQIYGPEPYSFSGYADTRNDTRFSITTGKWSLRDATGKTLAGADQNDSVTLTVSGKNVVATVDGKKYSKKRISGPDLQFRWNAKAVAKIDRANGTYKYGTLTATNIGGRLNIVNVLDFNTEYLYGIAEVPSSWGLNKGSAALQAQAITARSYALKTAGTTRKAKCNCDIVDDVRDQNYTGWNKAGERYGSTDYGAIWRSAVDATVTGAQKGKTLTYGGAPIATYYFSSSGGRTANSEDVWASALPWARSEADPYSLEAPGNTMASWTRTLTQAQAQNLFGIKNISRIVVTSTYSSGQARTLTATSSTGQQATLTGKADRIRSIMGLPSSWITRIS